VRKWMDLTGLKVEELMKDGTGFGPVAARMGPLEAVVTSVSLRGSCRLQ
jgi:hypothetical protein